MRSGAEVVVCGKARPVGRGHQRPVAALGGDGNDVRGGAGRELPRRLSEAAGRPLDGGQPLAVRRPRRVLEDGRPRAQPDRRRAAVRPHLVQVPAVRGPGDEGDPLPVRRPGRLRLDDLQVRQASRLAVRQRPHVEPVERRERQPRPVGRRHGVTDLPHREPRAVVDRILEGQLRSHGQLGSDAERHGDRLGAGGDRNAPDAAPVRNDDLGRVGRERHPGQHVAPRHRFLVVALDGVGEPAFVPGRQLAQPQPRPILVPGAVDQPGPVGRDRRAERRAVARGPDVLLPGLPVVDAELVLRQDGVVLPQPLPLREPDVPPVGRRGRPGDAPRLRLVDELHPGAAVDVPHPELRVALVAAGERPRPDRRDHVVAVRQPVRRLVVVDRRVGHLPRGFRLDIDPPEVLGAVPVRHEDHLRAVRAVARLGVVGHPLGKRRCVAARERDRVEVAQQVEDDGPAARADVDRDPGPLVGVERQGPVRLQREVGRVRPATLLGGGASRCEGHEPGRDHERGHMHRSFLPAPVGWLASRLRPGVRDRRAPPHELLRGSVLASRQRRTWAVATDLQSPLHLYIGTLGHGAASCVKLYTT